MDKGLKEGISQFGLTIRDFTQFALPGFIFIAPIPILVHLPWTYSDTIFYLDIFAKIGLILFIIIMFFSYLAGQIIACTTHVIDGVTLLIFRRRLFGVPFPLQTREGDYRTRLHSFALTRAASDMKSSVDEVDDSSFDTLMEYMLYTIMLRAQPLFLDIQRHQSIVYMRKHMVLAVWTWTPLLAYVYNWWNAIGCVGLISFIFFVGYIRLFRRTFFERLPLGYVSLVPKDEGEALKDAAT